MDDVLMSAPLFAALDVEAASALKASMDERRLLKGDILFAEGDPGDRLYVVTDGKIKLGHASGDGRESLLAVMGEGEMFGELSLFDPGPRTATATALTDVTVLGLGHQALRPWLTGRPEVEARRRKNSISSSTGRAVPRVPREICMEPQLSSPSTLASSTISSSVARRLGIGRPSSRIWRRF